MTAERIITLPGREDMLTRLIAVSDEPHFKERLYPLILQHAGQERAGSGIALMLALAIEDYCKGLPGIMRTLLYVRIDKFIDAVAGEGNQDVASEAKAMIKKTLKR